MSELSDRAGLQRRAGIDHVAETVPWRRRIGGKFGPTVELPAGSVSDDTQLRLATSRSILPSGEFDVETFAEIEMTVWPSYALGAGRGSLAAAAALRKRDVSWASNFFDAHGTVYMHGGGNGAAMRIQPHVWASDPGAERWAWLADVLVNSIVTHGHSRGFVGAVFHGACLDFALRERHCPGPSDWVDLFAELARIPEVAASDERLSDIWLRQWQKRSGESLEAAVANTVEELRDDLREIGDLQPGQRGAYAQAVENIKAFDAAHRGSGTKTALLAAIAAWLFEEDPSEAVRAPADFIGTDTDSIATMAGAIVGATRPVEVPGQLQDVDYILLEADRAWAAGAGLRPPRFPYPDVLKWRPPRSGTDAIVADDDLLYLAGLGPGGVRSDTYSTSGNTPGIWQWTALWFGQTVLAKRRDHPPRLVAAQRVDPQVAYRNSDRWDRAQAAGARSATTKHDGAVQDSAVTASPRADLRASPDSGQRRSLDEITTDVIRRGLTDDAIGAGLRQVAAFDHAIEAGIAYNAIIIKALLSRRTTGAE